MKKLTKGSNNCRICLTSWRRDVNHIRQSNLSIFNQIFVLPNICLCYGQHHHLMEKYLIECRIFSLTLYPFAQNKKIVTEKMIESMIETGLLVQQVNLLLQKFLHGLYDLVKLIKILL